ncbi:LADA_0H13212g1_1 [Lachancea dasiensis]|uniref:LADA_0H13212g1_1 n=1 Tax=Lachancea dasiensis TaxID=1072105 RepID=A0A1G4K400_9SACH|nr:LADA_0H13212g1_1 [Lachancea dasiensis]
MSTAHDPNEAYRQTQFQIYNLQQTLLNSSKNGTSRGAENQTPSATRSDGQRSKTTNAKNSSDAANDQFKPGATLPRTEIDSRPVLAVVDQKFGRGHPQLGTLAYDPWKTARLEPRQSLDGEVRALEAGLALPRPFLPAFGLSAVNSLVAVDLRYENITAALQDPSANTRVANNELWGSHIYTDDSDPLLALIHCGVLGPTKTTPAPAQKPMRTPANLRNTDNVVGSFPPGAAAYDLKVDLLLLPPLQAYCSTYQNGIRSRSWDALHDGLSYGIYAVEIIPRDHSLRDVDAQDQVKTVEW